MGLITKINGLTYANTAKYSGVTKVNTKKVGGTGNFHNKNAVSRSITAPGDHTHSIHLADSNGDFRFTDDTAFSISVWVKPGWTNTVNASCYLWSFNDTGQTSAWEDSIHALYYEPHNRIYFYLGSSSTAYFRQFWHSENLDPAGDRDYTVMLNASGLGDGGGWDSSNRGNVGNDEYTLITFTKGTSNSPLYSNLKMYWNATDCGYGYYGTSSPSGFVGTPNLGSSTDKAITLGSTAWTGSNAGNNAESKYMNLSIWDKELSASEVAELYNSGTPLHVGTHSAYAANCVGWYPFQDDGTGEVSGTESFAINGDSNIEAK